MPQDWQYWRIVSFIIVAVCGKWGGITPVLMPKALSVTKWLFFVERERTKITPKDLESSSLTSYITSTVLLPISNRLIGVSDQSDTGGNRQWPIAGTPLTDFYAVTLSASASWIVQGSSNSLSLISVFPGGSTAYEEYPLFILFKRITSAGTYVFM